MIRIASPRLVPVIELDPGTYATESRQSPGTGLSGLTAVSPGSWFVLAEHLGNSVLAIVLTNELSESGIPGFPDADGEIEDCLQEAVSALSGGYALMDGSEVLVEPSCCGDLGNLAEWQKVPHTDDSEWHDLWIGHPQLRFRVTEDEAEIEERQEYNQPRHPRHFSISVEKLRVALQEAAIAQRDFEGKVRDALESISALKDYSEDQFNLLARLLVGRSQTRGFTDNLDELSAETSEALTTLGYHRRWLDHGVLTRDLLAKQYKAYLAPNGDKHLEHYRIATWASYFEKLTSMSDEVLQRLLELADDPDFAIVSAIPHRLIQADFLTHEQFERVSSQLDTDGYKRLVARHRLLRELRGTWGDKLLLERCVREGDYVVHEALLEHPKLGRSLVQNLAEHGANKKIRNIAGQLLKSRQFREKEK